MKEIKILVVIPCLYGVDHCREAIDSVVFKKDVGALLIDNGATPDVSAMIGEYFHPGTPNVDVIRNRYNLYVTGAWQQGIDHFLKDEKYSHMVLMNSDLIMHNQWADVIKKRWQVDPDEVLLPIMAGKRLEAVNTDIDLADVVTSGTPGVFITMNRTQAKMVNPLPAEVKVWFGDNWIYEILRGMGYQTKIPKNLFAFHHWSKTVEKVPNISEIIEADKVQWEASVKPKIKAFLENNGGHYVKYEENL